MLLQNVANAQLITGYWKGKIDRQAVELKLVKSGDSLTGTSYYYQSASRYRRYSIKGYFNQKDNSVIWWDEVLLEENGRINRGSHQQVNRYLSNADFNCPNGTNMYLTGTAVKGEDVNSEKPVALEKREQHLFIDEWDEVIDNYTVGGNDPWLIDSVSKVAFNRPTPEIASIARPKPAPGPVDAPQNKPLPVATSKPVAAKPGVAIVNKTPAIVPPTTNQQKFDSRSKKLTQEIPVSGDSITLQFYDNAEVDGDSIAIYLNNRQLYEHVKLSDKPFTITLPAADLQASNELVMVAENLGSIPPNTSLMIAAIAGKRYEARLESTEQTSALIRFVKN